jgi:hypothetical protein
MTFDAVLADALQELTGGTRHRRIDEAELAPRRAGLYAFYGDDRAWADLELTPAFDDQPLHVGKAERSLNGRDVGTHFASGKTGSSTVRRSLASLLTDQLELIPAPRNRAIPDGSANFALEAAGDARLSQWMDGRLTLATWVTPDGVTLDEVETAVVSRLRPPLNLDKVGEPRDRLRKARRKLADLARAWQPDQPR